MACSSSFVALSHSADAESLNTFSDVHLRALSAVFMVLSVSATRTCDDDAEDEGGDLGIGVRGVGGGIGR